MNIQWINNLEMWLNNFWLSLLSFFNNLPICNAFREIGVSGSQKFLLLASTSYIYTAVPFFVAALFFRWLMRLPRYNKKGEIIRYKQYGGHSLDQRLYQTGIILLFASMICIIIRAFLKYL